MAKAKLILDDEGFEILGNALLLGYAVKTMERQKWPAGDEEDFAYRLESSESSELRDVLEGAGAHDRRLAGGIDATGGPLIESFPDIFKRWAYLANSDADIANLRLREIDFSSYHPMGDELLSVIENASGYDLRTPIATMGPTELTRRIKKVVLGYYNNDAPITDVADVTFDGETTKPKSSGTLRGWKVEDEPFIELAMELLKSKRAKNANVAMLMIEDGLWKEIVPEAKSFMAAVAGHATYVSKRSRLYKELRSRWKSHLKNV